MKKYTTAFLVLLLLTNCTDIKKEIEYKSFSGIYPHLA